MMSRPSRIARAPGPWSPQLPGGSGRGDPNFVRCGSSNLDIKCKESLQQILRPNNYSVIVPWVNSASKDQKEDMVRLARSAAIADSEASDPRKAWAVSQEKVQVNAKGRPRLAQAVHCTPDRAQSDLLRNRHGEDQRDASLARKRRFFTDFVQVPSSDSVNDFYRLSEVPVGSDASVGVLSERARRGLQRWQVHGPEKDREVSASVMRSLRSLNSAIKSMPSYSEQSQVGSRSRGDVLFEFSKSAPRGMRSLPKTSPPGGLLHSNSAPATLRPLIDPQDISTITKPGGYVVKLTDKEPVQMLKNKQRNQVSKIPLAGGNREWSTTYEATVGQYNDDLL